MGDVNFKSNQAAPSLKLAEFAVIGIVGDTTVLVATTVPIVVAVLVGVTTFEEAAALVDIVPLAKIALVVAVAGAEIVAASDLSERLRLQLGTMITRNDNTNKVQPR